MPAVKKDTKKDAAPAPDEKANGKVEWDVEASGLVFLRSPKGELKFRKRIDTITDYIRSAKGKPVPFTQEELRKNLKDEKIWLDDALQVAMVLESQGLVERLLLVGKKSGSEVEAIPGRRKVHYAWVGK